jgi:two-component system chemotaxis sensor kinase CheA
MIDSTPGSGTRMMLNVPLTLSIVPSLTIGVGKQTFAIPRSYVEEIVRASGEEMDRAQIGGRDFITVRGQRIACVGLDEILGVESTCPPEARLYVLIRLVGGDIFGLAVDAIHNHEELVVKPIAPVLMACGFYVGTTQLDDGSPILMLDISGIAREAGLIREVERVAVAQRDEQAEVEAANLIPALLVVGFDGRRRAVPMSAVDRVETLEAAAVRLEGEKSQVVIEDRILPLLAAEDADLADGSIELFRLSDGHAEIAYAFREMVDTTQIDRELAPAEGRPFIAGVALVEGEPVDVLDCHALFARHGRIARPAKPPVCRLPGEDRWFQDFLRPLVESAGYQVIDENDEAEADLAIAAHGENDAAEPARELRAGRAIWLRSTPEETPETVDTIYRYDRDRLLDELRAGRAA